MSNERSRVLGSTVKAGAVDQAKIDGATGISARIHKFDVIVRQRREVDCS
jgi:hypothetical protein